MEGLRQLEHLGFDVKQNPKLAIISPSKSAETVPKVACFHLCKDKRTNLNVFWHENDAYTLTSHGYIWTYPHQKVCEKSVIVAKNSKYLKFQSCYGVCSDNLV